ncbi:hypothetical protein C8Q75DRAFT_741679 [Abortiporus biennis]|nr:hypothetical protein C8Q75DRAFT_741679 [Abortiporus biennis]
MRVPYPHCLLIPPRRLSQHAFLLPRHHRTMTSSRYTPLPECLSQPTPSQPTLDDVVEDSEPEREKNRRERSSTNKSKKKYKSKTITRAAIPAVVEISDDDVFVQESAPFVDSPIHDIPVEDFQRPMPSPPKNVLHVGTTDSTPFISIESPDTHKVTVITRADTESVHSEDEGGNHKFIGSLGQFAYRNPSKSSMRISSSSSTRSASTPRDTIPEKAARTKVQPHRFTMFSDPELQRLDKCVCCALSWTARKTVVQKMKHIQTCGKKNNVTDETIILLIRKELITNPPTLTGIDKGKGKATESGQLTSQTLLQNVVNEAAPRKRGRRQDVVETIQSPTNIRSGILSRARTLLGGNDSTEPTNDSPGLSEPTNFSSPPRTQPFGESALANKFKSKVLLLTYSDTQPYAPTLPGTHIQVGIQDEFHSDHRPEVDTTDIVTNRSHHLSHKDKQDADIPSLAETHSPRRRKVPSRLQHSNSASTPPPNLTIILSSSPPPSSNDHVRQPLRDPTVYHVQANTAEDPIIVLSSSPGRLDHNTSTNVLLHVSESGSSTGDEAGSEDNNISNESDSEVQDYENQYDPPDTFPDYHNLSDDPIHYRNDDAYLHYEPNLDDLYPLPDDPGPSANTDHHSRPAQTISPTRSRISTAVPNTRSQTDSVHHVSQSHLLPSLDAAERLPTQNRKPRKKTSSLVEGQEDSEVPRRKSKSKTVDIPDSELFIKLKQSIMDDKELYGKVLRYEPVHFEVFLQLALDLNVPSRKLKHRVKSFLDKQAVHFYGLAPSGGRTRKRHL